MKPLKSSEILTRAKKKLWNGEEFGSPGTITYICCAIEAVSTSSRANRILDKITVALGSVYTLRLWLDEVAGVPRKHLTSQNVQRHRLRWMDRMIAEYKAKGD